MTASNEFYKSKRWQRLRAAILQRDGFQCQISKTFNRSEPANTVHHIFPIEDYPQYRWEEWNLISVCSEIHNALHDRNTGALTRLGEDLRREVAKERGLVPEPETILVIGNPGSGKTTYVRRNLGSGVVYDLDAIASAFRLRIPKEERHNQSRWIANSLLPGFAEAAHRYVDKVYIIRTAPKIEEIETINPTKLVVIYGNYGNEELKPERRTKIAQRIKAAAEYAKHNGIALEEIERPVAI